MEFTRFDPRDVNYLANLEALLKRYPGCVLTDNVAFERALNHPDPESRMRDLQSCADNHPRGDAAPRALFELAKAYSAAGNSPQAQKAFAQVVDSYPDSPWATPAQESLKRIAPPKNPA
jgi:TolA-binding protein